MCAQVLRTASGLGLSFLHHLYPESSYTRLPPNGLTGGQGPAVGLLVWS